jgi:mono/diheme cytochrome c family protein
MKPAASFQERLARGVSAWVFVIVALGCGALPEPQPVDATWAAQKWPDMSLERLKFGRELYAKKCSGCHVLKSPESVSAGGWAQEVADMRRKMGDQLSDAEAELIVRYLVTAGRGGRQVEALNTR